MLRNKPVYFLIVVLLAGTLACSISRIQQQAQSVEKTAQSLRTEVGGMATTGGSLLNTAQALSTQFPGAIETVKALGTQGAPLLSTIQAVGTHNPGLVQTAQAFINQEIPTGEPPSDIPIINRDQVVNYFGSSQYIFYICPTGYSQVLEFYKNEMPNNAWQYLQGDSHEYANAAQLNYSKNTRIAMINISLNPLNNTTVVVISIVTQ